MKCFAVAKRIILQIIKDKRSLGLLFIAPVFVLFLLNVIFSCKIDKPNILEKNLPDKMVTSLKKYASVSSVNDKTYAMDKLKLQKCDAFATINGSTVTVNVEGTETSVNGAVKKAVASAVSDYMKTLVNDQKSKAKRKLKILSIHTATLSPTLHPPWGRKQES